tara:strand:+ start:114 stop:413 length:300 start_codon:yes stop_codon:yes gene_type:complete
MGLHSERTLIRSFGIINTTKLKTTLLIPHQNYIKIFAGSSIAVFAIKQALLEENIIPIVKDQSESGRLAGFGAAPGYQEVFVHPDEGEKSLVILDSILL